MSTTWKKITKTIVGHYFRKCCIPNSPAGGGFMCGKTDLFDILSKKKKNNDLEKLDSTCEEVLGIYFVYIVHKKII